MLHAILLYNHNFYNFSYVAYFFIMNLLLCIIHIQWIPRKIEHSFEEVIIAVFFSSLLLHSTNYTFLILYLYHN